MQIIYFSAVLLYALGFALAYGSPSTVFDILFRGKRSGGYYFTLKTPHSGYHSSNFGHETKRKPQQNRRSYQDICRLVNANGFTNPGGVPRCPY